MNKANDIDLPDLKKEEKIEVESIPTPSEVLDFIKQRVAVLTEEDRSNPTKFKYHYSYHDIDNILDQRLFFKKNVETGSNRQTIEVEYQALYLTKPLQGFLPAVQGNYIQPPAGHYTGSAPDHVMMAEVWVIGIITENSSGYPPYVSRQSPWFKLESIDLYSK